MRSGTKICLQIGLLMAGAAMVAFGPIAVRCRPYWEKQFDCVWSVLELDKKLSGISGFLARFRGWIQAIAALGTNIHLPNFFKGTIYQGKGKLVCVPGLNCYSCPGAAGTCPIGAMQAVIGSSKFKFAYYITGFLILLGVLLGRFICGFLCPFGWHPGSDP